ncbi:hypothetical protein M2305_000570 [Gluconobacter cerinus]|nr:hypothetical protein [Gluconobacter cerinus]
MNSNSGSTTLQQYIDVFTRHLRHLSVIQCAATNAEHAALFCR